MIVSRQRQGLDQRRDPRVSRMGCRGPIGSPRRGYEGGRPKRWKSTEEGCPKKKGHQRVRSIARGRGQKSSSQPGEHSHDAHRLDPGPMLSSKWVERRTVYQLGKTRGAER